MVDKGFFKVVSVFCSERVSMSVYNTYDADVVVVYDAGKVSTPLPGNGPLCVFSTVGAAVEWMKEVGWTSGARSGQRMPVGIWACKIRPSAKTSVWGWWGSTAVLTDLYPQTVLADEVMLTTAVAGMSDAGDLWYADGGEKEDESEKKEAGRPPTDWQLGGNPQADDN